MYSALLHCFCCACRVYTRNRRRQRRRMNAGKIKDSQAVEYTGTATIDPSWPEAAQHHTQGKINDNDYYDDDEEEEEEDIWDRMESRVPFGAVVLIIIGYIFLGAFMFNKFEGWTMVQAVYFCYITLATVGFGDYVCNIFQFILFLFLIYVQLRFRVLHQVQHLVYDLFLLHFIFSSV